MNEDLMFITLDYYAKVIGKDAEEGTLEKNVSDAIEMLVEKYTAQNCEALNNAIREGLENNKLRERIAELEEIEEEHRKENGKLQEKIKEYKKIVETYNVIPADYIPKDMKIVIADREYFANGILKETCLPKSKIKEKLEQVKDKIQELTDEQGYWGSTELLNEEEFLLELLEEEE